MITIKDFAGIVVLAIFAVGCSMLIHKSMILGGLLPTKIEYRYLSSRITDCEFLGGTYNLEFNQVLGEYEESCYLKEF